MELVCISRISNFNNNGINYAAVCAQTAAYITMIENMEEVIK